MLDESYSGSYYDLRKIQLEFLGNLRVDTWCLSMGPQKGYPFYTPSLPYTN